MTRLAEIGGGGPVKLRCLPAADETSPANPDPITGNGVNDEGANCC